MLYDDQGRDPLAMYLAGGNPTDAIRDDAYYGYLARSQTADLTSLRARVDDLQAERRRVDEDSRRLADQADAQKSAQDALAARPGQPAPDPGPAVPTTRRATRCGRGAGSGREAADPGGRAAAEDHRSTGRRRRRARREVAKRAADAAAARKNRVPPSREPPPQATTGHPRKKQRSRRFRQLRGQLRLPSRGAIVGRFGAPRGSGGATWKGVFVKTENGADVHAVAAGKVVFSDDLRGFGNLLIVDHGDQYLSIYGNNETLLKKAGDAVKAGELISRAGNSSGDDQDGSIL